MAAAIDRTQHDALARLCPLLPTLTRSEVATALARRPEIAIAVRHRGVQQGIHGADSVASFLRGGAPDEWPTTEATALDAPARTTIVHCAQRPETVVRWRSLGSVDVIPAAGFPLASAIGGHFRVQPGPPPSDDSMSLVEDALGILLNDGSAYGPMVDSMVTSIFVIPMQACRSEVRFYHGSASDLPFVAVLEGSPVVDPRRAQVAEVAGAIAHEAMHTCLWLAELDTPLFASQAFASSLLPSPWKGTDRPARLVLHALITFGVELFQTAEVLACEGDGRYRHYLERLTGLHHTQAVEARSALKASGSLTEFGAELVDCAVGLFEDAERFAEVTHV